MAKAPIKAYERIVGYYFEENNITPVTTDLYVKKALYFSGQTPPEDIDVYLRDNFQTLYDTGAIEFNIPADTSDTRNYITCMLAPTLVTTIDGGYPYDYPVEDFDIDICYNRGISTKTLEKDSDNLNIIKKTFQIVLDPCTDIEIENSLKTHYQSYFLLGIEELSRDTHSMSWTSNIITKKDKSGTKR